MKGGRGSTKSSFVSIEIILGIVKDPKANALVVKKVANTLRDSVYSQMVWAIEALGWMEYFQCKVNPMEIVLKATGQKVLFIGADDPQKSKGLKLSKGYFKYLWFEEASDFNGMEDIRTIKASAIRGGGYAATFLSYNPPKSANNWINAEVLVPKPGMFVHHSDYTQVPTEWLGASFIAEAKALEETNQRAYDHMYMGEVTGTGGSVFDNVTVRPITKEERETFDRFYYGGDFGFAGDPDAFMKMYYGKSKRQLFVLEEVYGIGMNTDVLGEKVKALVGREQVRCDHEPRMVNELRRRGIGAIAAKKGPGSIEHGMRWLQDLGEIIIDPITCPNTAREFTTYEYKQDRFGNFVNDYPDENNHTIDAVRYGMEPISTMKVAKIINRSMLGI